MKLLGIELSPLWVPIERRLQTLVITVFTSMFFVVPIAGQLLAIGLFFTSYYWISIGYFVWCFYDNYFNKASKLSNFSRVQFPSAC